MKNWLSALLGFCARAAPTVPRMNGTFENSASSLVPGPTHAGARRVPGLGHEAVDHAVEDDPVIESLTSEFLNTGNVGRGHVGAKFDHHPAIVQVEIEGEAFEEQRPC